MESQRSVTQQEFGHAAAQQVLSGELAPRGADLTPADLVPCGAELALCGADLTFAELTPCGVDLTLGELALHIGRASFVAGHSAGQQVLQGELEACKLEPAVAEQVQQGGLGACKPEPALSQQVQQGGLVACKAGRALPGALLLLREQLQLAVAALGLAEVPLEALRL